MSHEGDPQAADVRSFLPRPGEPVEEYAARLRALHHDLTLVLDAVERGLAAAERPPVHEVVAEPEPVGALAEPVDEPRRSPPPFDPFLSGARGGARVEVVTTGREQASSGPPEPGGSAPTALAGERRAPGGERAPDGGDPAALSPERPAWVERPPHQPRAGSWAEPGHWDAPGWPEAGAREAPGWSEAAGREGPGWSEPAGREGPGWPESAAWAERRPASWPPPPPPPREMSFDPPYAVPTRRRGLAASPVLLAATVLGWLTVLALVLALVLD